MESPTPHQVAPTATPESPSGPPAGPIPEPVQRAMDQAQALGQAVIARDEARALDLALELTAPDFDRPDHPRDLDLLRRALELGARAMVGFVLADEATGDGWRHLMLPDALGLLPANGMPTLAAKLRSVDSTLLAAVAGDALTPDLLSGAALRDQALILGRHTLLHDAGAPADLAPGQEHAPLDLAALRRELDPRLHPWLDEWLLTCYSQSPLRLVDDATNARQDDAITAVLAADRGRREPSPAGSGQSRAAYHQPYRSDTATRDLAEAVIGGRLRQLFARFAPLPTEVPHERPDAAVLGDQEVLVVCPNWHEHHVIYRCMGALTRGLVDDGMEAASLRVLIDRQAGAHPPPTLWQDRCTDLSYDHHHALSDLDAVVRALASTEPELVFYPEISPVNSSLWMATRRIGRVQATGYGFPCTSGMGTMDYFVGGSEVEGEDAADTYTEDLVLIPGLGVTTTTPPEPTVQRARPLDDERVRLVTITSRIKLNRDMLRSWNSIQDGPEDTVLTSFTNLPEGEVMRWAEPMAPLLPAGDTDLRTSVPRQTVIDELVDADVYLDAFPFGGFNTLVEVLCAGCPVVTLEGRHARNRFGAAILRRLDLPDFLITKTWDEYVAAARRLVANPGLRAEVRARIGDRERVLSAIHDPSAGAHFAAAMRYLRERGPRKKSAPRSGPVLIEAGERPRRLAC